MYTRYSVLDKMLIYWKYVDIPKANSTNLYSTIHIYINVTVDELKTNYTTVNLHLSNVLSVCTVPKAAT